MKLRVAKKVLARCYKVDRTFYTGFCTCNDCIHFYKESTVWRATKTAAKHIRFNHLRKVKA